MPCSKPVVLLHPTHEPADFHPALSVSRSVMSLGRSVIAKVGTAANAVIGVGILVVGEDSRMIDEEMGIVEDYIVTQEAR